MRMPTAGKWVLPRDQARDGARKQVRVSPVHPRSEGRGAFVRVMVIAVAVLLVGLRLLGIRLL